MSKREPEDCRILPIRCGLVLRLTMGNEKVTLAGVNEAPGRSDLRRTSASAARVEGRAAHGYDIGAKARDLRDS
jgi:hypothetical protein